MWSPHKGSKLKTNSWWTWLEWGTKGTKKKQKITGGVADKNRIAEKKNEMKHRSEGERERGGKWKQDKWMWIQLVRVGQHWSNSRMHTHTPPRHLPPSSCHPWLVSGPLYIFLPNLWLVVAGAFIMKNKRGKGRTERRERIGCGAEHWGRWGGILHHRVNMQRQKRSLEMSFALLEHQHTELKPPIVIWMTQTDTYPTRPAHLPLSSMGGMRVKEEDGRAQPCSCYGQKINK